MGRNEDRLDTSVISALTLGRTWTGRQANSVPFVRQADEHGSFAYRCATTIFSGTMQVEGDMLCQLYEGALMGRKNCSHIYRNPNGTREGNDEYVLVSVDALMYFSVKP